MAGDVRWMWMGSGAWSRTFERKDTVVNGLLAAAKSTLAAGGTTIAHVFIAEGDHGEQGFRHRSGSMTV